MQATKNLRVAECAKRLAVSVYRHTSHFPAAERFGLTDQMRRSALSIPLNIAEGCGRRSNRELVPFLYNAAGSASELACQLEIATELGFGDGQSAESLREEIGTVSRMLARLIGVLRARPGLKRRDGRL